MLDQTVLPFKLCETDDVLTAHGGLALFGEFCAALGFEEAVDRHLPGPGSAKGFRPSKYVHSLVP